MSVDLYGEYIFDADYYAKKLIALGAKKPFYRLELLPDYIDNRFAVRVYDGENLIPLSDRKGYYVIYKKNVLYSIEKAIYAGVKNCCMFSCLRRFGIELCNMTELVKTSGEHFGGRKYRLMGGTRDDLYLKFVLDSDIDFQIPDEHVETLDEHLANLLDTLCNTRKRN